MPRERTSLARSVGRPSGKSIIAVAKKKQNAELRVAHLKVGMIK